MSRILRVLSPEGRKRLSEATKRRWGDPTFREERRVASKQLWSNPEYREKVTQAVRDGALAGPRNPHWKGGINHASHGYIRVWKPEHPRANKAGYVLQHILVWEEAHARPLPEGWVIHHLNGLRDDNRPKNLLGVPEGNHHAHLLLQTLKKRIRELEGEVKKLKTQRQLWG